MKKNQILLILLFCTAFLIFSSFDKKAKNNSQWRGPERTGIYPEKGLLTEWPENGPQLLWKYDGLGLGHTSVAITANKIYTTGIIDSMGVMFAFDHKGILLWKKPYGRDWMVNFPGTRTTPLIIGKLAYLVSGHGIMYCLNSENGDVVWSKDILTDYKGVNPEQGLTENLVIDGDKIFCTPGGPEDNVVALNRMTGKEIWKSKGYGEFSAFCSPLLIEHGGKKYLITMTAKSVISVDAETGDLAWRWGDLKYKYPDHPSTPIYQDGFLFVNDGGEGGSSKLKIAPDGKSVETIWTLTSLDFALGGGILMDNRIYHPSAAKKGWVCADWNTGRELYSTTALPAGSIIAAEGMLYCFAQSGQLALLKPTETEFQLKGQIKVPGDKRDHWAHPVIYDGKLFVRYLNTLWVYTIKS